MTVFDYLIDGKIDKAREAHKHNPSWKDYYNLFIWEAKLSLDKGNKYYGFSRLDDYIGISNGGAFIKLRKDTDLIERLDSQFKSDWAALEVRCNESTKQAVTGQDGANLKSLMMGDWQWGVEEIFDYLGYSVEVKKDYDNPFLPGADFGQPIEKAKLFGEDFFTKEHKEKQLVKIGGQKFWKLMVWMVLKLLGAELAKERNITVYAMDEQGYLRIQADSNVAYVCDSGR